MRQDFLMLAEGAEAVNGKMYVLGGGVDLHHAPGFPTMLKADIALGFLVGWGETNRKIDVKVRVVDEDEAEAFSIGVEAVVGRAPTTKPGQDIRSLVAIRGPFPIPKAGAYKAMMVLDGEPQEPAFRFWVDHAQLPVQPANARRGK